MSLISIPGDEKSSSEEQVLKIPDKFRTEHSEICRRYKQMEKIVATNGDLRELLWTMYDYLLWREKYEAKLNAIIVYEEELNQCLLQEYLYQTRGWEATVMPHLSPRGIRLLELLDFDHQRHAEEAEECMKFKDQGLNGRDEMLEMHAMRQPKFKDWMTSLNTYSSLLVDGNGIQAASGRFSAVSILSTHFEIGLELSNSIIVIRHFCGLHTDSNSNPDNWVPNMVKSLIAQLFTHSKDPNKDSGSDLRFITEEYMSNIGRNRLGVLCEIFQTLLLQLSPDIVLFCILDSISKVEVADKAKADLIELLRMLSALKHGKIGCTTKFF